MEEFLRSEIHAEFARRMEEEHTRQNHRISDLEESVKENNKLLLTVERLVISVENMQRELKSQGEKLDEIDSQDGKKWRKVTEYIVTAILGIVIGVVASHIGL